MTDLIDTWTTHTSGRQVRVLKNNTEQFTVSRRHKAPYHLVIEEQEGKYGLWLMEEYAHTRLFLATSETQAHQALTSTADAFGQMDVHSRLRRRGVPGVVLTLTLLAGFITGYIYRDSPASLPVPTDISARPMTNPAPRQPVLAPAPATPSTPEPTAGEPARLTEQDMTEARQLLAQRLSTAAANGSYTVSLSTGHARTLYLFSDPECGNCRIFESTIQALAQQFNVVIFPVTLVGKSVTATRVAPLLCAPADKRAALWRDLFDIGAGMLNPVQQTTPPACDAGLDALARNDMALDMFGLPGTPTVISDDGRMIPLQAMTSDEALKAFLDSNP